MMTIWDASSIREARVKAGLTAKAAAESMDITPEYLSMVENGHREPSQKLIAKMSEAYTVPVITFLAPQKNLVTT